MLFQILLEILNQGDVIFGTCSAHGRDEKSIQNYSTLKGKKPLRDLSVDGVVKLCR
jgi:hypothetical protein